MESLYLKAGMELKSGIANGLEARKHHAGQLFTSENLQPAKKPAALEQDFTEGGGQKVVSIAQDSLIVVFIDLIFTIQKRYSILRDDHDRILHSPKRFYIPLSIYRQ